MRAERYVLDSSALFTLFQDEEGAARVQQILREGRAIIPRLVLLEIYYVNLQRVGRPEADRRYGVAKRLPAEIVDVNDESTLLTAGRFKAAYRLSLADALIAAIARTRDATLVHKDPEFEALDGLLRLEPLPYRSGPASAAWIRERRTVYETRSVGPSAVDRALEETLVAHRR